MSVAIAPQLDYSTARKVVSSSGYRYTILYPRGQDPTLQLSSTTRVDFEIPAEVMNLSRSYATGTITVPADAIANTYVGKVHSGFLALFQNVKLAVVGGPGDLVDIQNLPLFSKVTMPATTRFQDFMNNPTTYIDSTDTEAEVLSSPTGFFNPAHCAGRVLGLVLAAGVQTDIAAGEVTADAGRIFQKGAFYIGQNDAKEVYEASNPKTCVSQCIGLTNVAIATASIGYVAFQIPLNQIKESLFSVDKDLYFGKTLLLSIDLQQGQNLGYRHLAGAALAPTTAASSIDASRIVSDHKTDAYGKFVDGTPAVFASTGPALSKLRIWLAKPDNEIAREAVKQLVESQGIDLYVPSVSYNMFTHPVNTAGTVSSVIPLDASKGRSILRIWSSVAYGYANTGPQFCLNSNSTGDKESRLAGYRYTEIQSKMNSVPEQDTKLSTTSSEDWLYLRDKLEGSVVQNPEMFGFNSFWLSDYTGVRCVDFDAVNQVMAGKPLGAAAANYSLEINCTAMGANMFNNLHTWAVFQRQLSIKNGAVTFV